jgi:carbamoyl-phosphate synthase large subunit
MNVLLTSAGRRTYMVEYFKDAVKPYGGKVHAMNSSMDATALWLADHAVQAPLIYDPQYESFLLNYCLEHEIVLVISLFDIELPVLSRLKTKFKKQGITVVVGDEWLTTMANDKWNTQSFLKENSFNTVPTFISLVEAEKALNNSEVKFPLFVKPRWGMGSIAVYKAENLEELHVFYNKTKRDIAKSYLKYESGQLPDEAVLIQSALPGEEYGLDIINDLDGNHCITIVKKKLGMRAGETDGAETMDIPALKELGQQLALLTKHPGNMDVDVFFSGEETYILELNPRFGGGYPFSHQAGVNVPKAIVEWAKGHEVQTEEWLQPVIGTRAMKGIAMITQPK